MSLHNLLPVVLASTLFAAGCAVDQAPSEASEDELRGATASDDLGAPNDASEFENRLFRTHPVGGPKYDLRSINVVANNKIVAEVQARPQAVGTSITAKPEVLLLDAQMRVVARSTAGSVNVVLRYQPRTGGKVYLAVREQSGADMPYAVRFGIDSNAPTTKLTGGQAAALVRSGAATRRAATRVETRGLERECAPGNFGPLACDSWGGSDPMVPNFASQPAYAGRATIARTAGTPTLTFIHNDGEYDRELVCTFDAPESATVTCVFTATEDVMKGTFTKESVTLVDVSLKANRATRGAGRTFWSEREARVTIRFSGLLP